MLNHCYKLLWLVIELLGTVWMNGFILSKQHLWLATTVSFGMAVPWGLLRLNTLLLYFQLTESLLHSFDKIYTCTDPIRIKQNKLSLLFNILVMHLLKGVDRDINVNIGKISAYSSSERTHRLHLQQQQERVRTHHWLYKTQLSCSESTKQNLSYSKIT